jgi:hypothetical protein
MEGALYKITYKNKTIHCTDYSVIGKSKEKTIQNIYDATKEWTSQPLKSVLALVNCTNLKFDMEILKVFKETNDQCNPHYKKLAMIGVKGLLKAAYNFVVGLTQNKTTKIFNTELEAKEWLVSD